MQRSSVVGAAPASTRLLQLDLLRGFAIFAVLGMHSPSEPGGSGLLRPIDSFIHRYGWTGVDLFFVLSGFLIGGLLFTELRQHGNFDARRFFLRRALRIWPSFYVFVAFVFIQIALEPGGSIKAAWASMWPALVHIQNFILCPRDHLWSLAVEEHFYALLPLFLLVVTRNKNARAGIKAVPLACIIICVSSVALRSLLVLTGHASGRTQTYMCIDALFFGVNLAYLKSYRPDVLADVARRKWTLLVGFLLILPAGVRSTVFLDMVGYTMVYLGYALILIHIVSIKPGEGRWGGWMLTWPARLVAAIGVNSYSIYLWHRDAGWLGYDASKWLLRLGQPSPEIRWLCNTVAFMVAGIIGGSIIDKVIEQPTQRIRAKLFPARPSVQAALPATASPALLSTEQSSAVE